jgi:Tfp pilus assembly protein PilF
MLVRRSNLPVRIVCDLALFCAVLGFPSLAVGQSVTLRGQVRTRGGQVPSSEVTVRLESESGMPAGSRTTDSGGNFVFDGLTNAIYQLTITADGFQDYEQDVDLGPRGSIFEVNVFLTPVDKTKRTAAPPALTDVSASKTARKEFQKGDRALREKRLAQARAHLERAVAEYPCYARAQADLAQVDMVQQRVVDAEAAFKKAIGCDGSFLNSFYELAQLYILEKKFNESETIVQQGLRLAPEGWLFYYQLGRAHYGMQKYKASVQDYLKAQSIHADVPTEFHAHLANAYIKTGDYSRALGEMETYLRLDPKGVYAESARNLSASMRADGVTDPIKPQASSRQTKR